MSSQRDIDDKNALLQFRDTGNHESFTHLWNRFSAPIYNYMRRRFRGNRHLAEDATQVFFTKVVRKAHRYDGQHAVSTWFFSIANRVALDTLRHEKSDSRIKREWTQPLSGWTTQGPHSGRKADGSNIFDEYAPKSTDWKPRPNEFSDEEIKAQVEMGMDSLPPKHQQVLTLHYLGGHPLEEIAQMLDIPLGTVKSRLSAGLANLRKVWRNIERRSMSRRIAA